MPALRDHKSFDRTTETLINICRSGLDAPASYFSETVCIRAYMVWVRTDKRVGHASMGLGRMPSRCLRQGIKRRGLERAPWNGMMEFATRAP